MSSNRIMSKRWVCEENQEEITLFAFCTEMCKVCYALNQVILNVNSKWNDSSLHNASLSNRSYITNLVNLQVIDQLIDYLTKVVKSLYKLHPALARLKDDDGLIANRHKLMFKKLCLIRFVMLDSMKRLIETILSSSLHREDVRKTIESALRLVELYNQILGLSYKKFASHFNVCSNTYPCAVGDAKPLTLMKIVQILSKSRVEINCHRLINCLLKIYKPEDQFEQGYCSSTSESIEIYHTLTKHMTPPTSSENTNDNKDKKRTALAEMKKARKQTRTLLDRNIEQKPLDDIMNLENSDFEINYASLMSNDCGMEKYSNEENINGVLQSEEMYIEILLDTVSNMTPVLLGANGLRKLKSGRSQAGKKISKKLTEYYQNVLWGDVGSCLEHIVLWWAPCPLAARSPSTSQSLREWLFLTFNSNNTPELILAALRILADALGCHVTSTSWDKNFGSTLKTNLGLASLKTQPELSLHVTECSTTGANYVIMLNELVTLNNQCEVTWEYIMGAPISDLPIVEQIPILHRLDHSVHTYRLWCLSETRRLASIWSMDDFFRIAHNDMQAFMEQLLDLRFADHSVTIETGNIGVHENVCAKMREKLVSEVKINIQKLKEATEEITSVLSSVCTTTCLAHLSMVFPSHKDWRDVTDTPDANHSLYVHVYLDKMLLPVTKATGDLSTLNMILRIMCESWLHHIFVAQVRFSNEAALQLLADFNEVRNWLSECKYLSVNGKKHMLQNEVLRRCEGVGRLLLHTPGDLISMQDSTLTNQQRPKEDNGEGQEQMMPAEMYVPNQKQWLTLRATKGPVSFNSCCLSFH